ncbi:hypothetical protein BDV95DRAFT_409 [Massariosphaeria phaeospora]|uniref:Uncharacterized protein n=1 Tax=Massariosphaeria phaeospora TaxID=100035 RepID=A0A7C8MHM6_9PLEO|nr:hypothetical protein BDV95DRAFT_409 [Massariosphaeria phaeospora]
MAVRAGVDNLRVSLTRHLDVQLCAHCVEQRIREVQRLFDDGVYPYTRAASPPIGTNLPGTRYKSLRECPRGASSVAWPESSSAYIVPRQSASTAPAMPIFRYMSVKRACQLAANTYPFCLPTLSPNLPHCTQPSFYSSRFHKAQSHDEDEEEDEEEKQRRRRVFCIVRPSHHLNRIRFVDDL